MWPFNSPDIDKLKEERDIQGLVKALGHRKRSVREAAVAALAEFEDEAEIQAIIADFRADFRDRQDHAELQRQIRAKWLQTDAYFRALGKGGQR